MSLPGEKQKLEEIRAALKGVDGVWSIREASQDGAIVECASGGERCDILTIHPAASFDERNLAVNAPEYCAFLLGLVDRAIDVLGRKKQQAETAERSQVHDEKNYVAQCAMLCDNSEFKVYLEQNHGLERPLTKERAAQRVRSVLAIQSRNELNTDAKALARWRSLLGDFEHWKRVGK